MDQRGYEQHERDEESQRPRSLLPQIESARTAGKAQREEERIFKHLGEDLRRDQRREDAAQHAARRHPKVEFGQVLGARTSLIKRTMCDEGRGDESRDAEACRVKPGLLFRLRKL